MQLPVSHLIDPHLRSVVPGRWVPPTECTIIEAEIQLFLDRLHEWMKPEAKGTDLLNQPASSFVHREPLGVPSGAASCCGSFRFRFLPPFLPSFLSSLLV